MCITDKIRSRLFELGEAAYRNFQASLIPTVDKNLIIGVRTPLLRKYAKELCNSGEAEAFLSDLPHKYYEENNLHAFIIERERDFDSLIKRIDEFLPFIDNWATCDSLRPALFKTNKRNLLSYINKWLSSSHTYTVRFAIEQLMLYFLDEEFSTEYLEAVSKIKSEEYYINMMIAWYFSFALVKQYDLTLPYLTDQKLSPFIHRKTIQKATESFRITEKQKEYLKKLRF